MKTFLIQNKKLSLALLAGILTTAIALGGIFAWFTSTAPVVGGEYEAAKVAIEISERGATRWNWLPGSTAARDNHEWLMTNIAGKSMEEQSAILGDFWLTLTNNDIEIDQLFDLDDMPYMMDGELGEDSLPFLVSPGSIVTYSGPITNESNIPVYLRIKNPKPYIIAKDESWEQVPATFFAQDYGTQERIPFIAEGEWLYLTKPLGTTDDIDTTPTTVGDKTISVNLVVYAPYSLDSKYSDGTIKFENVDAELIQATNDAAYFAWSKTVPFEPYVAPAAPIEP